MQDLRLVRAFVTVAEEQSFTRAARLLNITQPALSRQVKSLEDELGVELLIRDSGSVRVSPAGEYLLPVARKLLSDASEAALAVRGFATCREKNLAVGYLAPNLGSFLADALTSFQQVHNTVQVSLHELSPGAMMTKLRDGLLDVAFIGYSCPELAQEFDLFEVRQAKLHTVLCRTHPLANRSSIALKELAQESFIGLSTGEFPGRQALIRTLCEERGGFTPKFSLEADGLASVMAFVASNRGIALMPDEVASMAPAQVVFLPINDIPPLTITVAALVARDEARQAVRLFLNECRQVAS